ncbi:hypothetical protein RDWZM_003266 [Blomia tropicalis]|uniref:Beta-galactosidase n=1 Tax=Blomia tropicalis TaxID=40697 RepID=A0A9Q0RSD8_BLOTA|nr:hypothetical protein RDWZM_003266 [Blomia tropicalis]
MNQRIVLLLIFICSLIPNLNGEPKRSTKYPTLYEYYTNNGIRTGLEAKSDQFTLNGKPFVIYGGSFHYFRVRPEYWRSILTRFRAAGLNTVQMYLPWNQHEDVPGHFDFESSHLNLSKFLTDIKDLNLFAILRIGPYICAEWDLGGFPSWLLRDQNIKLRSFNKPFLERVSTYWTKVFSIINSHQFTKGGSIIALQIENEYGSQINHNLAYLTYLKNLTRQSGFKELLFTSDPVVVAKTYPIAGIDDLLETANLNENAYQELMKMRTAQPNKPIYVSEFWPGWFDSWGEKQHHRYKVDDFDQQVNDILFKVNGSINYYMFIGGTNFGFMNGGRVTTSYDYDAPLTESGNYTDKYFETRAIYDQLVDTGRMPMIELPDNPPPVPLTANYGTVNIEEWLHLEVLLTLAIKFENMQKPVSMEMLNIGPGYGQRYGFILYRIRSNPITTYEITGSISDRAIFLIDGNETSIIEDGAKNFTIKINPQTVEQQKEHNYDVLVENQGRINGGDLMSQRKGIESDIKLNGIVGQNLTIFSLDFNQTYIEKLNQLNDWIPFDSKIKFNGPTMYRTRLHIKDGQVADTFLKLPSWVKGNVFVNNFNVGRYWSIGPTKTLYVPGPLLKSGDNIINIFELHKPGTSIQFIDGAILEQLEDLVTQIIIMKFLLFISTLILCLVQRSLNADPTLYQYYTSGGVNHGLEAKSDQFSLNGKHFVIYGGSFHYFRVVPEYWRSVLQRFRAAGLNTVQMYVPWNLHEETEGKFDFESPLLNLGKFLDEVKAADMFAVVRIGPYICGEWDYGGFPAWLMRDPNLKLRTNYKPFLDKVSNYWSHLMPIINKRQFSVNGGPVIMLQIENEYYGVNIHHSNEYLNFLHDFVIKSGFKQLLFTSDPKAYTYPIKDVFPLHDVLETINLNTDSFNQMTKLKKAQVNRPAYVSEFWPGWFDSWNEKTHHRYSVEKFDHEISDILFKVNGSVTFYMFIGGTNFGFMNGARVTTSYDYDAPLTESGNYTAKYHKTRELYLKMVETGRHPKIHLPELPKVQKAHSYGKLLVEKTLSFEFILRHAQKFTNISKPLTMEHLPIGQNFGFILYRMKSNASHNFEITGKIKDRSLFMVNGNEVVIIHDGSKHFLHHFIHPLSKNTTHKFDVLVENQGRANWGPDLEHQQKGIESDIKLDGHVHNDFTIFSLDFNQTFVKTLQQDSGWKPFNQSKVVHQPAMYRATLKIDGTPMDTYLRLSGWNKGNVFVNGFNIGRYWSNGPQKTLYVPAPLLKTGNNVFEIFELHKPGQELQFFDYAILE